MASLTLLRGALLPWRSLSSRLSPVSSSTPSVRYNSQRAAVTKTNHTLYARTYLTVMVQPDGSTITVRHHLPRRIIAMPVDLSSLSQEERQARLNRRKPKKKLVIEDDIEDSFDVNQYSHLWKK